jgi:hypothetical protein
VRANTIFGFDSNGLPTYLPLGPTISATAGSAFNTRGLAAVASISGTVQFIQTAGFGVVGDGGAAIYVRTGASTPGGFQSADGAWWAITGPVLWAKQIGAACDGVTDDTAAFQALINSAIANKSAARFSGSCVASGLTITAGIDFGGLGPAVSKLLPVSGAADVISWATTDAVYIHDLAIPYQTVGASGAGLVCDGTSTALADSNVRSVVSNVRVEVAGIGLSSRNCALFTLRDSYFNASVTTNLLLNSPTNCDHGDNVYTNNTFIMQAPGGASVIIYCAGGVRFIGNKWNSVASATAVQYRLGATVTNSNSTAHLYSGNSIEGSDICFDVQRSAGTGLLINVMIKGNELVCRIGVSVAVSGTWVYNIEIDNQWYGGSVAGNVYTQIDGISGFKVGGELLSGAPNSIAAAIGATNAGGVVMPMSKGSISGGTWAASTLNGAISVTCSASCN